MLQLPNITSLTEVEKLESLGVIIEFTPEEEEMQPDYEEEENQAIADKYNAGNMAAWFCAKVTVTYKELSGTDSGKPKTFYVLTVYILFHQMFYKPFKKLSYPKATIRLVG
mgnify:CR=1 FL=1